MYELSEDEDIDIITSSDTDEEEKSNKERLANIKKCVIKDSSPLRTKISSESPGKYSFSKYCNLICHIKIKYSEIVMRISIFNIIEYFI